MPEIYVSTDVEADGPVPGPHSMLSFASAAYLPDSSGAIALPERASIDRLPIRSSRLRAVFASYSRIVG